MSEFLDTAIRAAREAGALLRANRDSDLAVNSAEQYDIKLEMDVRAQELIARILLDAFPGHAILGEEGVAGTAASEFQWIVDPIDGTVNYFYGIPHYCVSIALRRGGQTIVGVIHDPSRDELWSVEAGGTPTLNGTPIRVSRRATLKDAVLCVGFSKSSATIDAGLPLLEKMVYRARKCRMMGSAALDLAYIAAGRLDAFIEQGLGLWDIAAGVLLIESAGGRVDISATPGLPDKLSVTASNGTIDLELDR